MAPLPASGIISASQVGIYAFDRGATNEFSLSASLAGSTVNKGYTTALGPLWRGTSVNGDINNQQYNQGANNFSLSDWYSYAKGVMLNLTAAHRGDPDGACADNAEADVVYMTDGIYWGGGTETTVVTNVSVGYSNTSGTTIFTPADVDYYKVFEMNAAYTFNAEGTFLNEFMCP